ncbi:hypothetical protein KM043_008831 [Ampulex compressa]|nr:hypothetical protein KM043_008831 [Ampulex compressa]
MVVSQNHDFRGPTSTRRPRSVPIDTRWPRRNDASGFARARGPSAARWIVRPKKIAVSRAVRSTLTRARVSCQPRFNSDAFPGQPTPDISVADIPVPWRTYLPGRDVYRANIRTLTTPAAIGPVPYPARFQDDDLACTYVANDLVPRHHPPRHPPINRRGKTYTACIPAHELSLEQLTNARSPSGLIAGESECPPAEFRKPSGNARYVPGTSELKSCFRT